MNFRSSGTTVYSLYASISRRTNRVSDRVALSTHLSRTSVGGATPPPPSVFDDDKYEVDVNATPVSSCSASAFCTIKRYALYHDRKTSFTTPCTPSSLNLSGSARNTGLLIR